MPPTFVLMNAWIRTSPLCRVILALGWVAFIATESLAAADVAGAPPPVTKLADFVQGEAGVTRKLDIHFIVTSWDPTWKFLWAEASDGYSAFIPTKPGFSFKKGQEVRVKGDILLHEGLDPAKVKVTVLGENRLPPPVVLNDLQTDFARALGHHVVGDAYVLEQWDLGDDHLSVILQMGGELCTAYVVKPKTGSVPQWAGSFARITGLLLGPAKTEEAPYTLWVNDTDTIEVKSRLEEDPRFEMPETAVQDIGAAPRREIVRVTGKVLSIEPEKSITLRDASGQVTLQTVFTKPWRVGDVITAIGYPAPTESGLSLRAAIPRAVLPVGGLAVAESAKSMPRVTKLRDFWHGVSGVMQKLDLQFIVTSWDPSWNFLWAEEADGYSAFITIKPGFSFKQGQEVRVEGDIIIREGLDPARVKVTVLGENRLPPPVKLTNLQTDFARAVTHHTEVEAFVMEQWDLGDDHLSVILQIDGEQCTAYVVKPKSGIVPQWAGSFVRMTGLLLGPPGSGESPHSFWVNDTDTIEIKSRLEDDPRFEMPETAIQDIGVGQGREIVRVTGKIFSIEPGKSITLRDATGQVTLQTVYTRPWRVGEVITAIGHPMQGEIIKVLRAAIPRAVPERAVRSSFVELRDIRLISQVLALSPAEAALNHYVELTGVVEWSDPHADFFMLYDATGGMLIQRPKTSAALPIRGNRCVVYGKTDMGAYAPLVTTDGLAISGGATFMEPRPVSLAQALTGAEEYQWIQLVGSLHSIVHDETWTTCKFTTADGDFLARLPLTTKGLPELRSIVRVTGACTAVTNAKRQLTGVQLLVPSRAQMEWDKESAQDPFGTARETSLASLTQYGAVQNLNRRIKVTGRVLHHAPGHSLYLQSGETGLRAFSDGRQPLAPGQAVEMVGILGRQGSRLLLRDVLYRKSDLPVLQPTPTPLTAVTPLVAALDCRLVTLDAIVEETVAQNGETRLLMKSGQTSFEALLSEVPERKPLILQPHSLLRLTGVYVLEFDEYNQPRGFHLQLRTAADIAVLRPPPLWNPRRAMTALATLAGCIALGAAWVMILRRQVKRQTTVIAAKSAREAKLDARFRFIFESLPIGVSWMESGNPSARIVNAAYATMTGVAVEHRHQTELYRQAMHPDDWTRQQEWHRRLQAGEIDHYFLEVRYLRAEETFWMALAVRTVRDPQTGEIQELSTLLDITERKHAEVERERLNSQLLEISRRAGMAEIATNVLHNVGNTLNSVNVSANLVASQVARSRVRNLITLSTLLEANAADLGNFIMNDPKGRKIPEFVAQLAAHLAEEQREILKEIDQLHQHIDHIKKIVAMQQSHARVSGVVESIPATELVEDALRLSAAALAAHEMEIVRDYQTEPVLQVEKHKVIQILVNLIQNAQHACDESGRPGKTIILRVAPGEPGYVRLIVEDNGIGIASENLQNIFQHGFTTKVTGHGFGLHSSALAAKEMKGELTVSSEGQGRGATFTLALPIPAPLPQS